MCPDHDDGLVARGAAFATTGRLRQAVQDLSQALKLNPRNDNASRYLKETRRCDPCVTLFELSAYFVWHDTAVESMRGCASLPPCPPALQYRKYTSDFVVFRGGGAAVVQSQVICADTTRGAPIHRSSRMLLVTSRHEVRCLPGVLSCFSLSTLAQGPFSSGLISLLPTYSDDDFRPTSIIPPCL